MGGEEATIEDLECSIFGVLRTFSLLSSYFMNVLMAWAIYCGVTIKSIHEAKSNSYYYNRIIGIYVYSCVASVLPILTSSIGKGTLYCDLKADTESADLAWQIIDYIAPFFISFCCILAIMIAAIVRLKSSYPNSPQRYRFYRLLLFPTIFYIYPLRRICQSHYVYLL